MPWHYHCTDTCCVPERDYETCLTTQRRAGREHPCDSCPRPIKQGELYNRHFFPDTRQTYRSHIACPYNEE